MLKQLKNKTVLVTGAAGFIGFHLCKQLLAGKVKVIGVDSVNHYYSPQLKKDRLKQLTPVKQFIFYKVKLENRKRLTEIFKRHRIDIVCNLAAQAGVRYSLSNPMVYEKSNLEGFLNILELVRHHKVKKLVYASSSSVYGNNKKLPFSIQDNVDHPISLYAASKKANELMAYTYHHLFGIEMVGLRFFTVYGPWGRPDMALFKFTKAILAGRAIDVYNFGKMQRDFTYIDDIIAGVVASMTRKFKYEVFNLGNSRAEPLMKFIHCIEKELGKQAKMRLLPIQPGDVPKTNADIRYSTQKLGFRPRTNVENGIKLFIHWYKDYYHKN